ncbi:hypothetical protein TWF694_007088 [Orbilia ellipsospora]|uniref:Uncharacterized protein n=1 Tax=Orbilia ellipsospora TaxID=2528407 RepID=A0AAV9XM57_9PEZI
MGGGLGWYQANDDDDDEEVADAELPYVMVVARSRDVLFVYGMREDGSTFDCRQARKDRVGCFEIRSNNAPSREDDRVKGSSSNWRLSLPYLFIS